ncbi:hypothetical protein OC861_004043 [Tilletia horrida]|nr:hypothetical protein OC861_004043 [Tilletia horrida]
MDDTGYTGLEKLDFGNESNMDSVSFEADALDEGTTSDEEESFEDGIDTSLNNLPSNSAMDPLSPVPSLLTPSASCGPSSPNNSCSQIFSPASSFPLDDKIAVSDTPASAFALPTSIPITTDAESSLVDSGLARVFSTTAFTTTPSAGKTGLASRPPASSPFPSADPTTTTTTRAGASPGRLRPSTAHLRSVSMSGLRQAQGETSLSGAEIGLSSDPAVGSSAAPSKAEKHVKGAGAAPTAGLGARAGGGRGQQHLLHILSNVAESLSTPLPEASVTPQQITQVMLQMST